MGCDIHLYVETRGDDGVWETADTWSGSKWDESDDRLYVDAPVYADRNYVLFGFLANVRQNYVPPSDAIGPWSIDGNALRSGGSHGFAGVDTGDAVKPIDMPRGMPDDVCRQVADAKNAWGVDGHSHTWFTLRELLDAEWDAKKIVRGVVSDAQAAAYHDHGEIPDSWCGSCSSMDGLQQIEWSTTIRDRCQSFINAINGLAQTCDPDNTRLVMWFDS